MHKIIYNNFVYNKNHWACNTSKNVDNFITLIDKNNFSFLVKLNPTDSRGYRTIIQFLGKTNDVENINNTFNRSYTIDEKNALFSVTSEIASYYEKLGVIAQIEYAGNNSHEFKNNTLYMGKENEPSMLHSHII